MALETEVADLTLNILSAVCGGLCLHVCPGEPAAFIILDEIHIRTKSTFRTFRDRRQTKHDLRGYSFTTVTIVIGLDRLICKIDIWILSFSLNSSSLTFPYLFRSLSWADLGRWFAENYSQRQGQQFLSNDRTQKAVSPQRDRILLGRSTSVLPFVSLFCMLHALFRYNISVDLPAMN